MRMISRFTPIPAEYQEVDKLSVAGGGTTSGWIPTTLKLPKVPLRIIGKCSYIVRSNDSYLFSDRDNNGVRFGIFNTANNGYFVAFSGISLRFTPSTDTEYLCAFDISITGSGADNTISGTSTINGVTLTESVSGNTRVYGNNNIVFFNNQSSSTATYKWAGSLIGRFNVYSDGQKVYEFVPCYRKADDKAGLYELVTGAFFEGSGTITKGNDI